MENYNRALREKKELEKKLTMYAKEYKMSVNCIDMERSHLQGGLLDVQSKTKSLTDTVDTIATKLKEEKKKVLEELRAVRELKNHPQTGRKGNQEAIKAELERQEQELERKLEISNMKLELLTGQKQLPEVNKAVGVINVIGKKKGFGAILSNIRKNKADLSKLPTVKPKSTKPDFDSPRNLSELITEFHKLPKLYAKKPMRQQPKVSTVLLQQYEDRRVQRELAMSYGTRARIKRAQFHCNSLTGLYIPTKTSQKSLQRKTSLITLSQDVNVERPMRRALTH